MEAIEFTNPTTFERAGGRTPVTLIRAERRSSTDNWTLVDDDHATWYRKPEWDEDGKIAYCMPDSVKGQRILMTEQELNDMINNTKEETTMKTTFTLLDGTTYTMNPATNRYSKTVDDKTTRIGKAEYEKAQHEYDLEQEVENLELHPVDEQAELDKEPCRVEVENDLEKPAVLNQYGCVDCSKCNVEKCVHRNCMRRNPRSEGGLGECPRLDNGIMGEGQKISEEEGIEPAEAELEANIRAEQKKPRKARKSKDIAYEGHGKTLTAKQVDFILHLSDSCFWENGLESTLWTDVLCDEIGGQFKGKPMTVGAMISTLCEKGLGYRATDSLTDMTTGRSRKATYFALTDLGKEIAKELGL